MRRISLPLEPNLTHRVQTRFTRHGSKADSPVAQVRWDKNGILYLWSTLLLDIKTRLEGIVRRATIKMARTGFAFLWSSVLSSLMCYGDEPPPSLDYTLQYISNALVNNVEASLLESASDKAPPKSVKWWKNGTVQIDVWWGVPGKGTEWLYTFSCADLDLSECRVSDNVVTISTRKPLLAQWVYAVDGSIRNRNNIYPIHQVRFRFYSNEVAERVLKAIKHAGILCGSGKEKDPFAN
jgi:hypothetical protein